MTRIKPSSSLVVAGSSLTPLSTDLADVPVVAHCEIPGPRASANKSFACYLVNLDTLWESGHIDDAVNEIRMYLEAIRPETFTHLSPQEMAAIEIQLFILQHRLIALTNRLLLDHDRGVKMKTLSTTAALGTLLAKVGEFRTANFVQSVEILQAGEADPVKAVAYYWPTLKTAGIHKPADIEAKYLEKLEGFIAKGGTLDQIEPLSVKFLGSLRSGELAEWVIAQPDEPRIYSTEVAVPPNHLIAARGGGVLGAGSLRVFKHKDSSISHVIVGTGSGTYRPPVECLWQMVRHLLAAGVPREMISLQEGEAGGLRSLSDFMLKLAGYEGAKAQEMATAAVAAAKQWDPAAYGEPDNGLPGPKTPLKLENSRDAVHLNKAVALMHAATREALGDGVILDGESSELANAIEAVLHGAERAGAPSPYAQAMALVRHLAELGPEKIEPMAQAGFIEMHKRWSDHDFGSGGVDPADILGPTPLGRRARIVSTIGLAHNFDGDKAQEVAEVSKAISDVLAQGADLIRVPLGQADIEDYKELVQAIRTRAVEMGKEVRIMLDLPGHRVRLGAFLNPGAKPMARVQLNKGDEVILTTADTLGNEKVLPVAYPRLAQEVKVGDVLALNDGEVALKVLSVLQEPTGVGSVTAIVTKGGEVWDHRTVHLAGHPLRTSLISRDEEEKIAALLPFIDLMALSYVRTAEDVARLRGLLAKLGRSVPIFAKIATPSSLENLHSVGLLADGLIVASTEMASEIGYTRVPAAQAAVLEMGDDIGRPVVVSAEICAARDGRASLGEVQLLHSLVSEGAEGILLSTAGDALTSPEAIRAADGVISEAETELLRRAAVELNEPPTEGQVLLLNEIVSAKPYWTFREKNLDSDPDLHDPADV